MVYNVIGHGAKECTLNGPESAGAGYNEVCALFLGGVDDSVSSVAAKEYNVGVDLMWRV